MPAPLPIIDVAPGEAVLVDAVVVVDALAIAGLSRVALEEAVGSVGRGAAAVVASCAGGVPDAAHAEDQTANVTAMMVVFMSIPLVLSRGHCKCGPSGAGAKDRSGRRARRAVTPHASV
jgi:hypothetical protein